MTAPAQTFFQAHLAAEHAEHVMRWRAMQTVRSNIDDVAVQAELLDTLGLLDVQRPVELP